MNNPKQELQRKIDNLKTRLSYGLNKGKESELRTQLYKLQKELSLYDV